MNWNKPDRKLEDFEHPFIARVTGTYCITFKNAQEQTVQTNIYLNKGDCLPIFRIIDITLISDSNPKDSLLWDTDEIFRAFFMEKDELLKLLTELP